MKPIFFILFSTVCLMSCNTQIVPDSTEEGSAKQAWTDKDSIAYYVGYQWGKSLIDMDISDMDTMRLHDGVRDALLKNNSKVNMSNSNQNLSALIQQRKQDRVEKNLQEAEDFLEKNKENEEVITTESGLQYIVLKEGTGNTPSERSKVTVHYTGKFINDKVFDSSVERGKPTTFGVNQVISGWTEGLQLMKEGAKYKFFIPPHLGYGERDNGPIPANSLLIFDVELLKIN